MPNLEIQRTERYEMKDGIPVLIEIVENEVEVLTTDEEISLKEAELLRVYAEIQALKNNI